jgi:DNA-binding transcriptional LysR family regulator
MELRNLRGFLAVAREQHFGRAAASLNLTQPALSLRIQALERELGIQLLQRNAREVRLTPAGDALLEHAKTLVSEEDRALRKMKDHVGGLAGRLRIAYLTVWNVGLPAHIVAEFRRRFSRVRLETTSGYSWANVQRVMAGDVDLAFVGLPCMGSSGVVMRTLDRHEIVLVMSPTNHLAEMESVPIKCLIGEPMIVVSTPLRSPHLAAALRWLASHLGEEPNIVAEEPIDQIAAAVAVSGSAVTLTTASRAPLFEAEGLISRRLLPVPLVDYGLAYLQGNTSPALANILRVVDDCSSPFPNKLPTGSELVWTPQELDYLDVHK